MTLLMQAMKLFINIIKIPVYNTSFFLLQKYFFNNKDSNNFYNKSKIKTHKSYNHRDPFIA